MEFSPFFYFLTACPQNRFIDDMSTFLCAIELLLSFAKFQVYFFSKGEGYVC